MWDRTGGMASPARLFRGRTVTAVPHPQADNEIGRQVDAIGARGFAPRWGRATTPGHVENMPSTKVTL